MLNSKKWESGTVIVDESNWKPLKEHLIKVHNDLIDFAYKVAFKVYKNLDSKFIEDNNLFDFANNEISKHFNESDHYIHYFTVRSLFEKDTDGWCLKNHLKSPDFKEFEDLKIDLNAQNVEFNTGELTITLHDYYMYLGWCITDNIPNSITTGRNSTIGKACINYLNSIDWKEGYGGYIQIYNPTDTLINPLIFGKKGEELYNAEGRDYLPKINFEI